jgi:hypothetical protein
MILSTPPQRGVLRLRAKIQAQSLLNDAALCNFSHY